MGTAAAVVMLKERQVVDAFRRAGAIAPDHAVALDTLGLHEGLGWRRLHNRAVIREAGAGSGRYYLDEEVWDAVRRTRGRRVAVILVIALLALYASWRYGWGVAS